MDTKKIVSKSKIILRFFVIIYSLSLKIKYLILFTYFKISYIMITVGEDMKKGFTLVELLGVFSIMAVILLLSVPAVTNMLKKATESEYYSFEENIFLAAEAYLSNNKQDYPELKEINKKTYVTINKLLILDYLNSNMINPATKKKISEEANHVVIVYMNQKKLYVYELINNVTKQEIEAINAYEALTSGATETEKTQVKNLVNALSDSSIKIALQNKLGV